MRSTLLICMLALAGLCNAQAELDANARQAVIERVLEHLRSDYVFPDTAEQMVASIRERVAAGEYDAVTRTSLYSSPRTCAAPAMIAISGCCTSLLCR